MYKRAAQFWRKYWLDIITALIIFGVALVPRVLDLGTFLTADEKNWIGRSYEFIRAFKDVRLNDMLQTTHPGVIPLWLMGLGVTAKIILSNTPFSFQTLPNFIVAAQLPVAMLSSFALPAMYVLLRRVFASYSVATVAAALIALNPLLIGYSRVAHVDATLASFLFLAALATIIYAQRGFSRRWLVVSAILSAFAVLTKAPGIFIVPFWWLTTLLFIQSLPGPSLRKITNRLPDFIIWLLIIGILFVTIWPVFIGVPNPKGNANILRRDLSIAAATPHHMSEDYTINAWHYPAALITRTTPLSLIFSGGYLVVFAVRAIHRKRIVSGDIPVVLIISFIAFFILMMTLGAKKGDRYILPVFLAIDTLAAIGVIVLGRWLQQRWRTPLFFIPVASAIYLAVVVASYHPYAIAYSNPLFVDNLSQELGWGEGLEQVGAWLSQHDPQARVASWYPQELGAFTSAQILNLGAHEQQTVEYVVLYHNMFGRAPDHPANDFIDEYYKKRQPVFVAHVVQKPFAWVYQKQTYPNTVGELLPGTAVSRVLTTRREPVVGLELFIATYNGRASTGVIVITLAGVDGSPIGTWEVLVNELEDDVWHRFELPNDIEVTEPVVVNVIASGTSPDNAPTVRTTLDGELAARLLYRAGSEVAHEEHTKLLP